MITDEQLREWKALADKATPGPWGSAGGYLTVRNPNGGSFTMSIWHTDEMGQEHRSAAFQAVPFARANDAAFIAASRTAVPALCAEVERLKKQAEADRRELTDLREFLRGVSRQCLARSGVGS